MESTLQSVAATTTTTTTERSSVPQNYIKKQNSDNKIGFLTWRVTTGTSNAFGRIDIPIIDAIALPDRLGGALRDELSTPESIALLKSVTPFPPNGAAGAVFRRSITLVPSLSFAPSAPSSTTPPPANSEVVVLDVGDFGSSTAAAASLSLSDGPILERFLVLLPVDVLPSPSEDVLPPPPLPREACKELSFLNDIILIDQKDTLQCRRGASEGLDLRLLWGFLR